MKLAYCALFPVQYQVRNTHHYRQRNVIENIIDDGIDAAWSIRFVLIVYQPGVNWT